MILRQTLLTRSIRNVTKTVRRICIFILGLAANWIQSTWHLSASLHQYKPVCKKQSLHATSWSFLTWNKNTSILIWPQPRLGQKSSFCRGVEKGSSRLAGPCQWFQILWPEIGCDTRKVNIYFQDFFIYLLLLILLFTYYYYYYYYCYYYYYYYPFTYWLMGIFSHTLIGYSNSG